MCACACVCVQLLQHSDHILKLRQSDGNAQREMLIASVRKKKNINRVTPSERRTTEFYLMRKNMNRAVSRPHVRAHHRPPHPKQYSIRRTRPGFSGPLDDISNAEQRQQSNPFVPVITDRHVTALTSSMPWARLLIIASPPGYLWGGGAEIT